jgi:hypothetical protein
MVNLKKSTDRRILKLTEQLEIAEIDPEIIDRIMEGGEDIRVKTSFEDKADWFRVAMNKMDESLDIEIRKSIREGCACHLGGNKARTCNKIVQEYKSLEERIDAVSAKYFICGRVTLKENGEITACPEPEDRYYGQCVCLPKSRKPISITYCYCCQGHIKHHLQTALGCKLAGGIVTSPLSSGDKKPCTYKFRIVE